MHLKYNFIIQRYMFPRSRMNLQAQIWVSYLFTKPLVTTFIKGASLRQFLKNSCDKKNLHFNLKLVLYSCVCHPILCSLHTSFCSLHPHPSPTFDSLFSSSPPFPLSPLWADSVVRLILAVASQLNLTFFGLHISVLHMHFHINCLERMCVQHVWTDE